MFICELLRDIKKQRTASHPWGTKKLCLPKPAAGDTGLLKWSHNKVLDLGQHLESTCFTSSLLFFSVKKPLFGTKAKSFVIGRDVAEIQLPASHLTFFFF